MPLLEKKQTSVSLSRSKTPTLVIYVILLGGAAPGGCEAEWEAKRCTNHVSRPFLHLQGRSESFLLFRTLVLAYSPLMGMDSMPILLGFAAYVYESDFLQVGSIVYGKGIWLFDVGRPEFGLFPCNWLHICEPPTFFDLRRRLSNQRWQLLWRCSTSLPPVVATGRSLSHSLCVTNPPLSIWPPPSTHPFGFWKGLFLWFNLHRVPVVVFEVDLIGPGWGFNCKAGSKICWSYRGKHKQQQQQQ